MPSTRCSDPFRYLPLQDGFRYERLLDRQIGIVMWGLWVSCDVAELGE